MSHPSASIVVLVYNDPKGITMIPDSLPIQTIT